MNAADVLTTDVPTVDSETTLSKLASVLEDPGTVAVLVTEDDEYRGAVTRRDLVSSNRPPSQKARTLLTHPPTATPETGLREIARLMTNDDAQIVPILEDGSIRGVVTADRLLEAVGSDLETLQIEDVYTPELVTVTPKTTFGQALSRFRKHRIRHLPVIDDADVVGIVSVTDVMAFIVRELHRSQGGDPEGHMDASGGGHHGGLGSREGDSDDLLDVPIENVMTSVVATVELDEPLSEAVEKMLEWGISSLVVVDAGPAGIVTKTDVVRAIARDEERRLPVQIHGIDLLDDLSREDLSARIERVVRKHASVTVLEAKVHLHEHSERHRGVPLLLARIRLFTDGGLFVASGEGFGARHAISEALDAIERQLLDEKGDSKPRRPISGVEWDELLEPR